MGPFFIGNLDNFRIFASSKDTFKMTIDELYRLVQFIANKEQRGYVTPSEFNLLAERAQLETYRELYKALQNPITISRGGVRQKADPEAVPYASEVMRGALRPLITTTALSESSDEWDYPAALLNVIEINYYLGGGSTRTKVEIIDHEDASYFLNSNLAAPSTTYPIALRSSGGVEIFPTSINSNVKAVYYAKPSAPVWDYTIVNGAPVYDASGSTQLTLGSTVHEDIAMRVLTYIGISLRDNTVANYATLMQGVSNK